MRNQNTIKKSTQKLLFVVLILFLLPCFVFGASTSLPATKAKTTAKPIRDAEVKKPLLQKQGIKLTGPQSTKPVLRSAEITHLTIGTEASALGQYFWRVTIRNTGNVELEGNRVFLKGYKVSSPGPQNAWTGASGSLMGPPNLLPNQSRTITKRWTRCCRTDQLKIELKDNVSNKIWDTEVLTSLTYTPHRPLNVKVKAIEWNETTKSWRVKLKNFTNYTVRLSVIGARVVPPNMTVGIPAGEMIMSLAPNGEAFTNWKYHGGSHQGDILAVRTVFMMQGHTNLCNESDNDCGYQILDQIYLPNRKTFF